MAVFVETDVYKYEAGQIVASGCATAVSSESTVYQVEKVYLSDAPVGCDENPHSYMWLLKIQDPRLGIIWIDETAQSFADKIGQASGGASVALPHVLFVVGQPGGPADLATQYVNTNFASATSLKVEKEGIGTLEPGVDYDLLAGGGIELLGGATFSAGEVWFIWVLA